MKYIITLLLTGSFLVSNAQSLVDSIGNPGFSLQDSVGEKLAELAVKNRKVIVAEKGMEVAKYEIQKNKAAWLNNVGANFNLNEYNLNSQVAKDQNLFYPRYNLSLNLPLGFFFTKAKDVKIARGNYERAVAQKEVDLADAKEAIKMQYELYKANKYFLALHETILQDEKVLLQRVEAKFEKNQVGLEVFTEASKRYNAELVKKINLLKDLNNSKYQLEKLIGMNLEEALRQIATPK